MYEDPVPADAIPLRGFRHVYRLRLPKSYRMVYKVIEGRRLVIMTRIRPREEVYIGLSVY